MASSRAQSPAPTPVLASLVCPSAPPRRLRRLGPAAAAPRRSPHGCQRAVHRPVGHRVRGAAQRRRGVHGLRRRGRRAPPLRRGWRPRPGRRRRGRGVGGEAPRLCGGGVRAGRRRISYRRRCRRGPRRQRARPPPTLPCKFHSPSVA